MTKITHDSLPAHRYNFTHPIKKGLPHSAAVPTVRKRSEAFVNPQLIQPFLWSLFIIFFRNNVIAIQHGKNGVNGPAQKTR